MSKKKSGSTILIAILAVAVLLFLYLPIIVVVLYSFNSASISSFPMSGFTMKWYKVMFQNDALITSLINSIEVAVVATTLAIVIGVPSAYGVYKLKFPGKRILEKVVIFPMMLPGIITGISILSFLQMVGIIQGILAVILGHTTFLLGTVFPQVYTRLRQLDRNIEEASTDLGGTGIQTFFYVILPNIKTAIIGSALLSVTLSIDEIPVTFFLNGVFTTLPIQIYGMTRNGFTPEINAICTIILAASIAVVLISNKISGKEA